MKKKIVAILLMTLCASASDVAIKKMTHEDQEATKGALVALKTKSPIMYGVINDYFQAKTCSNDIAKTVRLEEIEDFTKTPQFGVLIGLKYQDGTNKGGKKAYMSLLNAYRFMGCGDEQSLTKYIKFIKPTRAIRK